MKAWTFIKQVLNEIKDYNFIRQKRSVKSLTHISRKEAVEFLQIAKDE